MPTVKRGVASPGGAWRTRAPEAAFRSSKGAWKKHCEESVSLSCVKSPSSSSDKHPRTSVSSRHKSKVISATTRAWGTVRFDVSWAARCVARRRKALCFSVAHRIDRCVIVVGANGRKDPSMSAQASWFNTLISILSRFVSWRAPTLTRTPTVVRGTLYIQILKPAMLL